jgi:hypothetical protein
MALRMSSGLTCSQSRSQQGLQALQIAQVGIQRVRALALQPQLSRQSLQHVRSATAQLAILPGVRTGTGPARSSAGTGQWRQAGIAMGGQLCAVYAFAAQQFQPVQQF